MSNTKLARLTPPGTGAIATLALRGPEAWQILRELAPRDLPRDAKPGHFLLTRLGESGAADEVVVAVKQITPEPWLELHCHGGAEVVRLLMELLAQRGAEVVTWHQLERTNTADPFRAAGLSVLANAPTTRTAAIALDQYQGAFTRAMAAVRDALKIGECERAERLLS